MTESDGDELDEEPITDEDPEVYETPIFGYSSVQEQLADLENQLDRSRGGLTERDREYLLLENLEGQYARRARMEMRERILNMYFDLRHLCYVSDSDREQVFEKAATDDELHLRNGIKEFIKFTHRSLLEYDVDTVSILEDAVREAEQDAAVAEGVLFDGEVDFSIDRSRLPSISPVLQKYENHEALYEEELAALVNNEHIDIGLADALYYQARQLWGSAHPKMPDLADPKYGSGDPDTDRAEQLVQELEDLLDELDIETFDGFHIEWDRLYGDDGVENHPLHQAIRELDEVAPFFDRQLADDTRISADDMKTLHQVIWNPDREPIETVVNDLAKPEMAGDNWTPAESRELQKFIARVETALEVGAIHTSWSAEHRERWEQLQDLAGFDPEEWSDYMDLKRVDRAAAVLRSALEAAGSETDDLRKVEFPENLWDAGLVEGDPARELSQLLARYGDDVVQSAITRVALQDGEIGI